MRRSAVKKAVADIVLPMSDLDRSRGSMPTLFSTSGKAIDAGRVSAIALSYMPIFDGQRSTRGPGRSTHVGDDGAKVFTLALDGVGLKARCGSTARRSMPSWMPRKAASSGCAKSPPPPTSAFMSAEDLPKEG